ncbi:carbonic anhydrase [Qipengyuania sp. ASV99]|uniref:carbonic anhydrase n=1 Tax=Qipengyuania sp. ASV99 TaxID=3399681 RepID=UPI003A4C7270
MMSRRSIISSAGALGAAAVIAGGATTAHAAPGETPRPPAPPASELTPQQALDLLKQGNADFLNGRQTTVLTGSDRRLELAKGQNPFAAYVTCSDSRVPPELLFGRGLGELFIIRNAGNTVDTVALGSIEYAVAVLKVPLVVVMGHESCGAVKAATEVVTDNAVFPGMIGPMIEPIIPAVLQARSEPGDLLENSVRSNVRRVVKSLREQTGPIMLNPQREGALRVVGAYYDLDQGMVDFFDVPDDLMA